MWNLSIMNGIGWLADFLLIPGDCRFIETIWSLKKTFKVSKVCSTVKKELGHVGMDYGVLMINLQKEMSENLPKHFSVEWK